MCTGDSRNDRKKSVRFGNNEPMDENILYAISNFMNDAKVSYKWNNGDIVSFLDVAKLIICRV